MWVALIDKGEVTSAWYWSKYVYACVMGFLVSIDIHLNPHNISTKIIDWLPTFCNWMVFISRIFLFFRWCSHFSNLCYTGFKWPVVCYLTKQAYASELMLVVWKVINIIRDIRVWGTLSICHFIYGCIFISNSIHKKECCRFRGVQKQFLWFSAR